MAEQIPYDEMRRILGLPDPPFDNGGVFPGMVGIRIGSPYQSRVNLPAESIVSALAGGAQWATRANGAAKDPFTAAESIQGFIDRMNEFARAAAAASAIPAAFYPPKPKRFIGPQIPRPSHTPPMWAPNPARTRRTKNGGIDMRTPRV